ncbi:hypothetical protein BDV97DRAFT_90798 [Delphinella strobiligena]|nr:hypothetical protein BDV97DRAFT_90798 [Delphinella strobiligena]
MTGDPSQPSRYYIDQGQYQPFGTQHDRTASGKADCAFSRGFKPKSTIVVSVYRACTYKHRSLCWYRDSVIKPDISRWLLPCRSVARVAIAENRSSGTSSRLVNHWNIACDHHALILHSGLGRGGNAGFTAGTQTQFLFGNENSAACPPLP